MMQKLNEIHDKSPFKVPEGYFEEVNRKIISATSGIDHVVRKPGLYYRFRPFLQAAAAVTGFILISYAGIKLITNDRINLHETEAVFEEYSSQIIDDIDIYSLEEVAGSQFVSAEESYLNDTDIIEYLILENIEISDIYDLL